MKRSVYHLISLDKILHLKKPSFLVIARNVSDEAISDCLKKKILIFTSLHLILFCLCISNTYAQDKGDPCSPLTMFISFYQRYISPIDGKECPSFPPCSQYAKEAIGRNGIFWGWIMTVDRLIHEGSEETQVSPMIFTGKGLKIYDPVFRNDFWWKK